VGKTAVVEGSGALRIVTGDVPPPLQNVTVRVLDLALLQAGAGVKGEFESRLKSVINEVKASPQPIITFIDEAHTLIGAGEQRVRATPPTFSSRRWLGENCGRSPPPPGPNTKNISRKIRR
jgi:ATP-dependent Clp protease ATP-binding subunit ClpA